MPRLMLRDAFATGDYSSNSQEHYPTSSETLRSTPLPKRSVSPRSSLAFRATKVTHGLLVAARNLRS